MDRKFHSVLLLGCSWVKFKEYLESKFAEGMTWKNHNPKGWHVDHIIPLSSFNLHNPEHQKKAFHYTNMQPLWWKDNFIKYNKLFSMQKGMLNL